MNPRPTSIQTLFEPFSGAFIRFPVLVLLLFTPLSAVGGNTRAYFLGEEAAMTGGAGTAVMTDSGAMWYNPAGLGAADLSNWHLSGSVFNGKIRRVPNFNTAELQSGVESRDAEGDGVGSVPGSASFIRNAAPNVSWGVGFFGNDDDYMELTSDIVAPYGSGLGTWHQNVAAYMSKKSYSLGPAVGLALTSRLRFGFSLMFSYCSKVSDVYASASLMGEDEGGESAAFTFAEHMYTGDINILVRGGMQWELVENWHFGAVVSTPVFTVLTLSDSSRMKTGRIGTPPGAEAEDIHEFTDDLSWKFEQREAASFELALAYKRKDRFWVGAEAEIRPPVHDANLNLLWNASVGARLYLSDRIDWGVGLFTDNSPEKTPTKPLDARINRYGVATGAELRIPMSFKGRQGERKLVWALAGSLSYSLETGEIAAIRMVPEEEDPLRFPPVRVFFHQVVLYVGSTLYF